MGASQLHPSRQVRWPPKPYTPARAGISTTSADATDLIVTVALGSTLATVLLSKSVALVEGLAAFALLVGLQYVVAWLSVRSTRCSDLVKSEPTLLLHQGRFLENAMRAQRVTRNEVLAALRSSGAAEPGEVVAVVLETDGSLSVLQNLGQAGAAGSLEDVVGKDGDTR